MAYLILPLEVTALDLRLPTKTAHTVMRLSRRVNVESPASFRFGAFMMGHGKLAVPSAWFIHCNLVRIRDELLLTFLSFLRGDNDNSMDEAFASRSLKRRDFSNFRTGHFGPHFPLFYSRTYFDNNMISPMLIITCHTNAIMYVEDSINTCDRSNDVGVI